MKKEKELNDYIKEVKEKISLLIDRNKMQENDEYLFAFRGEARDYGATKLMPSLFRNSTYITKEKYFYCRGYRCKNDSKVADRKQNEK